jgi:DNA-binding GntR family transcriptional regulator
LIDAIEVRAELEALGGRLAAERRTEQCLGDLEELYTEMVDAAARDDARDQALTNIRFHAKVIAAAHNPILQRQWSMLEPFSRTYVTAVSPGADLLRLSQRHEPILSAIRDQDPELAAGLSRTHASEAVALLEGLDDPSDEVTEDEGSP